LFFHEFAPFSGSSEVITAQSISQSHRIANRTAISLDDVKISPFPGKAKRQGRVDGLHLYAARAASSSSGFDRFAIAPPSPFHSSDCGNR
jgi:hypothetical protein